MTTNEKGNLGLAKVLLDLSEKGYHCFLPFTDTTCVDLIVANKKMNTLRVQVKHKKITNGTIKLRCASVINGKTINIDKSMIDYLSDFNNTHAITLRVDKSKTNNPTIKMAEEYRDFKF